ncbi:MAG: peptide chain release factor N(5)-glutamine methyltransferase [Pseudomonadota bacterium]|jgi:release factor glutamine methyltransferase
MMLREALRQAAARLAMVSETPRLDAELLAAHSLGVARDQVLLAHLDDAVPEQFWDLIARRLNEEPVAYITGMAEFWSIPLQVGPGVLIPRPDSETLITAAMAHFQTSAPATILDLGTGSGALVLAALVEWPLARGLGVDQSDDALAIATANAQRLQLTDRVRFQAGNWGAGLAGPFDLILCNPPYIAVDYPLARGVVDFEPLSALFAGPAGLDDYVRLAPQIAALLAKDGCACVEIGFDQALTAGALFAEQGLSVEVHQDLGGRDRALLLRKIP